MTALRCAQVEEFPVPSGDAVPEKLQADLTSELRALSELGYPHVGFLLQHEYTMSGLSPEVNQDKIASFWIS